MAANALKKINARVKQLAKKHPNAKRKTLQKQAGREYKAGKLKAKRKPAAKVAKVAKRKPRKVAAVKKSLGKVAKVRPRKARRVVKTTYYKYKKRVGTVGKRKSDLMPVLLIGGLAAAMFFLLRPAAAPAAYRPTGNQQRDNSASNILAYAAAAGLTLTAITQLINAINAMDDNQVIQASYNPAATVQQITGPSSTVYAPTGGPGITLNT